jgi:hypothetical protein
MLVAIVAETGDGEETADNDTILVGSRMRRAHESGDQR